jgi:hypothetical protein
MMDKNVEFVMSLIGDSSVELKRVFAIMGVILVSQSRIWQKKCRFSRLYVSYFTDE